MAVSAALVSRTAAYIAAPVQMLDSGTFGGRGTLFTFSLAIEIPPMLVQVAGQCVVVCTLGTSWRRRTERRLVAVDVVINAPGGSLPRELFPTLLRGWFGGVVTECFGPQRALVSEFASHRTGGVGEVLVARR